MQIVRPMVALLLFLPGQAVAQSSPFTHLLSGTIAFRAPLPWSTLRTVRSNGVDGVVLEYQEEHDTVLSIAIVAYEAAGVSTLRQWTDSILARARPTATTERLRDTILTPTTRSLLWKDDRLLGMDRFVQTSDAVVWVRMVMPVAAPHAAAIRARLHAIDDLLTTIRAEDQLLFPAGSTLGLVVR